MEMTSQHNVALYVEFTQNSGSNDCYQMILVPQGKTSAGQPVAPTIFRRQINPLWARKTWRIYTEAGVSADIISITELDRAAATERIVSALTDRPLQQMANRGWTVYKEPIAIEITSDDYADVFNSRVPYKVLGRINKVRKALGFEDFWKAKKK
jgi:hypothetical protein